MDIISIHKLIACEISDGAAFDAMLNDMRYWISDCEWADDFEVDELTQSEILIGVQRHYDGGIAQFIRDGAYQYAQ